jgi:DNA-binding beta-propeller fold protein YncE
LFVGSLQDCHYGLITKLGSLGTGDGQFNGPAGIDVDAANSIYVTDAGNNRIQVFTNLLNKVLENSITTTWIFSIPIWKSSIQIPISQKKVLVKTKTDRKNS